MLNYIKRLLTRPTEIYTARNMKKKHYFLFILFMGIILSFLSVFDLKEEFDTLSEDYQEIQSSLPDYELIDGKLESNQESYIYQTDSLVFYFDPENKIETSSIDKNMEKQQAPISASLQEEEIYLNILGQSRALRYADFDLKSQDLKAIISLENFSNPLYFMIVIAILLIFNLFLYLMQLFSISIFANFISFVLRSKLTFFQNAKIALVASMVPILLMAVLTTFNLSISYQYEITTLSSLLLFYLTIEEFKERSDEHKIQK